MRPVIARLLCVLSLVFPVLTALETRAFAQESPDAPPPGVPSSTPVLAGWSDGFVLRSPNDDYRLNLGAAIQMDGRFSLDDPSPVTDTFLLRKVRPIFAGRLAKYFEFRLTPDFGNGAAVIQDAYFEIHFSDAFRLRTGKDKTPVGYEVLLGDSYLLFPERSLVTSLMPSRDVGVSAQGSFANGRLTYGAGVFNGIPDGASSAPADADTDNAKDVAARVVLLPFKPIGAASASALANLGFEFGGTRGTDRGAPPTFHTPVGQKFFTYEKGTTGDGVRDRESAAVFYYEGSFGGFAEYTRSAEPLALASTSARADVANHAWGVTASYVLTGERTSDRGVRPTHDFDPPAHHWGAVQVNARYSTVSIDDAAFLAGLAAAGASAGSREFGVGINWYLTPYVRYYATFERADFQAGRGAARPVEHSVIIRAQLAF